MPVYTYKCSQCLEVFDRVLSFSKCGEPQVCECGNEANRQLTTVGVILKGDGWPGKNLRVRGQMGQKNRKLVAKSSERIREAPGTTLVPNVDGEEMDTWGEAKKKAASDGKNTSTYDPLVHQEQAQGRAK